MQEAIVERIALHTRVGIVNAVNYRTSIEPESRSYKMRIRTTLRERFSLFAQFESVRFCFPSDDGYSSNSLARVGSMRSSISDGSLPKFSRIFRSIAKLLHSARPCTYQLSADEIPLSSSVGGWRR